MTPAEVAALAILLAGAVALTAVVWWTGTDRAADADRAPIAIGFADEQADDEQAAGGPSAGRSPPGSAAGEGTAAGDHPSAAEPAATVVVDVAGLVVAPGLVELPAGARVADAIASAGGVAPGADTTVLNLARVLVDGEQVVVTDGTTPAPVAAGPGGVPGTGTSGPVLLPDGRLDLNAATVADLQDLPGVGPVTAERIVAHREQLGGFSDVVQLLEVSGIGPARFADLEARVGV